MVELTGHIPEDALRWRNDPSIWRWCRQNGPLSRGDHERWLSSLPGNPSIRMFGIKADGVFVGVCGLTSINRINQSAEFSLYIARELQGLGHGREALKALLRHGFDNENLNRIWGESYQGNPAIRIFLSLGMKEEGRLRESYFRGGRFVDSVIVSMLRRESDALRDISDPTRNALADSHAPRANESPVLGQ